MRATKAGAAAGQPVVATREEWRPYAASWLNHLLSWLEELPGPTWVAYGLLAVVGVALGHAAMWETGLLPLGTLDPLQVFWGCYLPAQLWVVAHLDRVARQSLATFRPALEVDDDEFRRIEYELTTIPARPALALAVVVPPLTLVSYALDPVGSGVVGYDAFALTGRALAEIFVGAVLLVFVYHTLRQLRIVGRLHARVNVVDPYEPRPLHAFSRLTSRTAIALLVLMSTGLAANPVALESSIFWVVWAPWIVGVPIFAVAVFLTPLYGMHRRLVAEKERIQAHSDARLRAVMDDLAAATDSRDVRRIDELQRILASQLVQREVQAGLPTWPWSIGTLRGFASALLLPILLFIVQRYLSEILAP
jgi:hypothetical protein